MSGYKRNILVGATVLVALFLLAFMMWRFSSAPFRWLGEGQMPVVFETALAEGISDGSTVEYQGVQVGRVVTVKRSRDNRTILIYSMVDKEPPLPANVEGVIRLNMLSGTSRISLELVSTPGAPSTQQTTRPTELFPPPRPSPQPEGTLAKDQHIPARFVGTEILPQEFIDLATDLRESSRQLRRIMMQVSDSNLMPKLADAVASLNQDIVKAGKVLDSIDSIVSDGKLRSDLSATLANFRAASESATRIAGSLEKTGANLDTRIDEVAGNANKLLATGTARIEDISKSVGDRLIQVANVLENFQAAAKKISEGSGTAGRLINDPKLYENLLDASRELNLTLKDLRRVVEQWEQEGVPLKLGK